MPLPPVPTFLFCIVAFLLQYVRTLQAAAHAGGFRIPPPFPLNAILLFIRHLATILEILDCSPHVLIRRYYPRVGALNINSRVWNALAQRPEDFWLATGETPHSLLRIVNRVRNDIVRRVRNPWRIRNRARQTRPNTLCVHDRVLMLFIWLRQYSTLESLAVRFGVGWPSYVCDNIYLILPILHEHYVDRYVSWPSEREWNAQRNRHHQFPNVVGAIDAFAVQINRPQGPQQRLYYRRDRGFHFLNSHVIVDNDGYFRFSRHGFLGHSTDAATYGRLPQVGYNHQLNIPQRNTFILADGGYPSRYPLLTPFRRIMGRYNALQAQANRAHRHIRVRIEHRIGDVRIYRSVPGRHGRFRQRRFLSPLVTDVVIALTNRRRHLIARMREMLIDSL